MNRIKETLLQQFDQITPLSDKLKEKLWQVLQAGKYKRRHYLLQEGEVAREVHYIVNGLARSYYSSDGLEVSTRFICDGQFTTSWSSFYRQEPSNEYIQLVKDSDVITFSYAALQQLYKDYPEFNTIARHFFEYHLYLNEECMWALRQPTAYKKYEYFLQHYPALARQLPVKYIAGFLGITKETLSRIRNRLSK